MVVVVSWANIYEYMKKVCFFIYKSNVCTNLCTISLCICIVSGLVYALGSSQLRTGGGNENQEEEVSSYMKVYVRVCVGVYVLACVCKKCVDTRQMLIKSLISSGLRKEIQLESMVDGWKSCFLVMDLVFNATSFGR